MAKLKPLETDFKIIAIKPLKGCKADLIKVLQEDQVYYFYNDYTVDQEDNINYERSYPDCLYDHWKTKINICAIAGKNGSGKSTVTDLLFMAINNIANAFGMKPDLVHVNGVKLELFIKIKTYHKIILNDQDISVYDYNEDGKLLSGQNTMGTTFNPRSMFYTICMNYSHYAYNSNDYISENQKDWLEALFHKNDAYQTPLVINPWRDEGNIIINRENELVKSRLVANLLRPATFRSSYDFRKITDNLIATKLVLTTNRDRFLNKELYKGFGLNPATKKEEIIPITYNYLEKFANLDKDVILDRINKIFNFGYRVYKDHANELNQLAMDYLVRKLITISVKYDEYNGNFDKQTNSFNLKTLNKYIKDVIRDSSHIAFKFKQTLNYLRHQHIDIEKPFTLDYISAEIQKVIDKKQTHKDKIIDLIPPPIFIVDIILEPEKGEKKEVEFKLLSSGEKQMAYSMSSILYHLFNLDSVRASTQTKVKYRQVQIVLEEIELYFHPEMQRRYIKLLRDNITNLELQSIKNISICFVTHSPFILSDIPNNNIMFLSLKDGKTVQLKKTPKTFAANIHNLLADGFFMQDGLCGAYAIDQINKTIQFLNDTIELKEVRLKLKDTPDDEKLLDRLDKLEGDLHFKKKDEHALLIKNIAEPVVASKLTEMYDQAFHTKEKDDIRARIAALQQQLLEN